MSKKRREPAELIAELHDYHHEEAAHSLEFYIRRCRDLENELTDAQEELGMHRAEYERIYPILVAVGRACFSSNMEEWTKVFDAYIEAERQLG